MIYRIYIGGDLWKEDWFQCEREAYDEAWPEAQSLYRKDYDAAEAIEIFGEGEECPYE